ncbi:MAG: ATP-binding protein [Nannocystaceae bacterium]
MGRSAEERRAAVGLVERTLWAVVAVVLLTLIPIGIAMTEGLRWQLVLVAVLALAVAGAAAASVRLARAGSPVPALERVYAATLAAALVSAPFFAQPHTMIGATIVLFVLLTAPRVLTPARTDLWVVVAIVSGLLLAAAELVHFPLQISTLGVHLPMSLALALLLLAFVGLALRDHARFPVKTKLYLVFLLVGVGPVAAILTTSRALIGEQDTQWRRRDLTRVATIQADAWERFLAGRRLAALDLAGDPAIFRACAGAAAGEVAEARGPLQRFVQEGAPLVHAVAIHVDDRVLARAGPPLGDEGTPGAMILRTLDPSVGAQIILRAPVGACTISVGLAPGLLRAWAQAVAKTTHLGVVLRDRDDHVLAREGAPEAALPAYDDLHLVRPIAPIAATATLIVHPGDEGREPLEIAAIHLPSVDWTLTMIAEPRRLPGIAARQARQAGFLSLALAGLATLVAFVMGRRIAQPLAQLTGVLDRFSAGEINARVAVRSQDELGELATRFNAMAAQVGGLLHSLESQAARLRTEVAERTSQEVHLQALNEELSEARDQALAANRAKSAFLARMSHELRTPLNAVIGYGEMIGEAAEERGDDELARDADAIVRSAKHLLELINDILDLSKIEAGRMELQISEFDAAELIRDVVTVALPLVERQGNTLSVMIDREPSPMKSDRTKIRQCLLNLLSNAAKFTRQGTIELRLRHTELGTLPVLAFVVGDTGIGMPPEALDKLFKPFSQIDNEEQQRHTGTGLGLAITRRLCRKLGGDINVASRLGVGTTFTIRLPERYHRGAESTSWGQSMLSSTEESSDRLEIPPDDSRA